MGFAEVKQALLGDLVRCVQDETIPPLSGYLADYVRSGCEVKPEDFRLLPLTPTSLRFLETSSECVTDGMMELQCKYQQFFPDDWGGRVERGHRDLGVIGFNILEGVVLDIREINATTSHLDWAEPILNELWWERLLVRAVVDFGRSCKAKQIRLQPAPPDPLDAKNGLDPDMSAEALQGLKQRYDGSAESCGFTHAPEAGCFVLELG
jgi:hypothetical protein